jgi:hypothetical protein
MKKFLFTFVILCLTLVAHNYSFASQEQVHPNDVGGFGQNTDNEQPMGISSPSGNETGTLGQGPSDEALDLLPPDDEVPIDGGAGILIAAGLCLGARKLKNRNNKK